MQSEHLEDPLVELSVEGVDELSDFVDSGAEDQHVSGILGEHLGGGLEDLLVEESLDFALDGLLVGVGPELLLHRVHPAGDLHDLGAEVVLEELGVHGGRCDDDLEVLPPLQQVLDQAQDDVDAQGPLVRLVDHQAAVLGEHRVHCQLVQHQSVQFEDNLGFLIDLGVARGLVVDEAMHVLLYFGGHSLGQGPGG